MTVRINCFGLQVADSLYHFIEDKVLPDLHINSADFWKGFAAIVKDLTPINDALLAKRDRIQLDLDKWHKASAISDVYKTNLLWSRLLMGSGSKVIDTPFYDGLSTTYCGHTISKYDGKLRRVLSHVCLDHGAYRSVNNTSYCLTMINANTQEVHVVS